MVAADDNAQSAIYGIQIGVTRETNYSEGPTCNKGAPEPRLYHFVEKPTSDVLECYFVAYTSTATSALLSVVRNADGLWRAYLNGNPTGS